MALYSQNGVVGFKTASSNVEAGQAARFSGTGFFFLSGETC